MGTGNEKISERQAHAVSDAMLAAPQARQREASENIVRQRSPQPAMGRIPALVHAIAVFFGFRP